MFTGIVETTVELMAIEQNGENKTFTFRSELANELKIDQSVAHNGVCLTIEKIDKQNSVYSLTAIYETLQKTNLNELNIGDKVNLERCMPAHGRFDGHIVQGHVDQTAVCTAIADENGSWRISFEYDPSLGNITVEKGSICVNGVSLTVVDSLENGFSVAIIPYTWEHTNFHQLEIGKKVNLEFDILGKYIQKIMQKRQ